jgi:hypothetical protein
MRFALILSGILSAGVALCAIPAAAAVSSDAVVVAYTCPVYEGYPDCHPDDPSTGTARFGRVPTLQSSAAPRARRVIPLRMATSRQRLPQ